MEVENKAIATTIKSKKQENMEQAFKAEISEIYEKQASYVNGMMKPEFAECNFEDKTLTLSFPILEWEKNRVGVMHGGVVGVAFDIAMGFLTRFLADQSFAPTISLETVFIRPISIGETLLVRVKANLAGRKLTHLYGEAFLKSSGKLAATATASYFNENTSRRGDSE